MRFLGNGTAVLLWTALSSLAHAAGAPAASTSHWSFQPPIRSPLPSVQQTDWPQNEIDYFILARLEAQDLSPSPEADKITLARRAYLDLIGLPPSLTELKQFLDDPRPDAYERLIDQLLASPHYGERWGRHWLDAARYADSNGYSIDAPRSIWPYRDWVINALNADMPFDQFTIEQLAGDLLPNPTLDQIVATGFHRNTQINQEGGIDKEQFRIESVIDRVDTTSTVFLGLTVACAQCHDHKFDPISQEEYYRLFAFLNNDDEPVFEVANPEEKSRRNAIQSRIEELEAAIKEGDDSLKPALHQAKLDLPVFPKTLVLRQRPEPRQSFLFIKGDFTRQGPDVQPGVPAILHPLPENSERDRLTLARWIVSQENPLTARVTVNRVWQRYFGRGIVETENDFGTQSSSPSHPQLLDWLATELIARNWSMKSLHRLIATSATYRQSSRHRPDLAAADPRNLLLGRQSRLRLDAEVVRDVSLSASGLFANRIGGPSVFPPIPDGVMNLGQARRPWKPDEGADRYRRGLYTFFWRATPHPSLTVFDAPDSFSTCTRRARSNTPLQALTLLNDQAHVEFAHGLARRVCQDSPTAVPDRIDLMFQIALTRKPAAGELSRLVQLFEDEKAALNTGHAQSQTSSASTPPADVPLPDWEGLVSVARAILNLDETITRE